MKKILAILMAAILVLGLAACSRSRRRRAQSSFPSYSYSSKEESESTPEESSGIDLAAVTEEDIAPLMEAFASVVAENFSVEADYENGKSVIINSTDNSKKIVTQDEIRAADGSMDISAFPGYEFDPTGASYYEVKNFKTEAELCDYLNRFMLPEIYESGIAENFEEIDGILYLVRGGRGYGAVTCGNVVSIIPDASDSVQVTAERRLFEEPDGAFVLTVQEVDGVLKITNSAEEEAVG